MTEAPSRIRLSEKFEQFSELFAPRIIGELNGQYVKAAKIEGAFEWHAHANEDELFHVIDGHLTIRFRTHDVELHAGDLCIIPRGVEHLPIAHGEVRILLFEPKSTINTGDQSSERTRTDLEWI